MSLAVVLTTLLAFASANAGFVCLDDCKYAGFLSSCDGMDYPFTVDGAEDMQEYEAWMLAEDVDVEVGVRLEAMPSMWPSACRSAIKQMSCALAFRKCEGNLGQSSNGVETRPCKSLCEEVSRLCPYSDSLKEAQPELDCDSVLEDGRSRYATEGEGCFTYTNGNPTNIATCLDECGVLHGDGTSCQGCGSGSNVEDACGVCGGDNSTCAGCDGVPHSNATMDACGECGGENRSVDACGVCSGRNESCAGCDGIANSQAVYGLCGNCVLPANATDMQQCRADFDEVLRTLDVDPPFVQNAKKLLSTNWDLASIFIFELVWTGGVLGFVLLTVIVTVMNHYFCKKGKRGGRGRGEPWRRDERKQKKERHCSLHSRSRWLCARYDDKTGQCVVQVWIRSCSAAVAGRALVGPFLPSSLTRPCLAPYRN